MVGPLPAGRKWTSGEERQLLELLASGAKAPAIARRLKRSTGAVYARINALKKVSCRPLPLQRLVATHAFPLSDQSKS
jgi:DNA-binding NarL/FixJ family response regulator